MFNITAERALEVMVRPGDQVVLDDPDVAVSVGTLVFVPQAEGMADLMDHRPELVGVGRRVVIR